MALQLMIPVDGSQFAEAAIPYAAELAIHTRAIVHLVKVHHSADESRIGSGMYIAASHLDENFREEDRAYLAKVADLPELRPLNPVTALINGSVVHALQKYVRSCGIDLVVMSTHGRGGVSRAWYGSVADDLIRTANVPVLLLRPPGVSGEEMPFTAGIHNVLLPVDGSEFSESLIETAAAIGGFANTRYTLLQVVQPTPALGFADGIAVIPDADVTTELRTAAETHLLKVAEELRQRGLSVETAVTVNPDVAASIRAYALDNTIDLIAMVTHGRGGWKRLALGSVSDQIMRGTSVPLLVLHPGGEDPQALSRADLNILEARAARIID